MARSEGLSTAPHAAAPSVPARVLVLLLALLPGVLFATSVSAAADGGDSLGPLQVARANAGLGPVTERVDWSAAAREHARYMVDNGVMTHDQDPHLAGATEPGRWAARTGNLYAASGDGRARDAVAAWLASPGHAAWLLHPGLTHVGFGDHRDLTAWPFRYAAVLPVIEGVDRSVPQPQRVTYPGDGSVLRSDGGTSATTSVRMLHLFRADVGPDLRGRVEVRVNVDDRDVEVASLSLRDGHLAVGLVRALPAEAEVAALVLIDGRYDDRWTFETSPTRSAPPLPDQRRGPVPWDIDGTIHAPAIRRLLDVGVVSGQLDGAFRPSSPVSRGQLATMLDGLLAPMPDGLLAPTSDGGEGGDGEVAFFPDAAGSVHAEAIRAVTAAGWMVGGADGRFRASEPVTRGQLASTLATALALTPADDGSLQGLALPGDVAGTTHEEGIMVLLAAGLATGYGDGTFRPDQPVSRGQLASVLVAGTDGR